MVRLADALGEVLSDQAVGWLTSRFNFFTVADLLRFLPERYREPLPFTQIQNLRRGGHVLVRGKITYTERRLEEAPGRARRVNVLATHMNDGTGDLELVWVERRNDVPPGLLPGVTVTSLGTAWTTTFRIGMFRTRTLRRMNDPSIDIHDGPAGRGYSSPGLDAPKPMYPGCDLRDSGYLYGLVERTLLSLSGLPTAVNLRDGRTINSAQLLAVLQGMHCPRTVQERDANWQYRGWAIDVLMHLAPTRVPLPPPRLIKSPRDAEHYAKEVLQALGFDGLVEALAGRDGGVDVRGRTVVAQVKLEGVKTDSQKVQALSGIAAHEQRTAVFFSLAGYTSDAVKWAEKTDMALFEFDYAGEVQPRSIRAGQLIAGLGQK